MMARNLQHEWEAYHNAGGVFDFEAWLEQRREEIHEELETAYLSKTDAENNLKWAQRELESAERTITQLESLLAEYSEPQEGE